MFPQCGFSNAAVQIMQAVGTEFEVFDVFTDESIRQGIKTYSDWPTIPQLYIDGEFVGGSDIMIEMFQSGVRLLNKNFLFTPRSKVNQDLTPPLSTIHFRSFKKY